MSEFQPTMGADRAYPSWGSYQLARHVLGAHLGCRAADCPHKGPAVEALIAAVDAELGEVRALVEDAVSAEPADGPLARRSAEFVSRLAAVIRPVDRMSTATPDSAR
ncbi:Uncharacterised protein [Nocardia otitidiscaviarum]|uniref:Uncharacterized protein n=1 Tax=Nocardia otitidiscaviarum TaxID=1823 RepID=A0A378YCT0_9NOCA|nr:hypothetical protein [Nocardia otitidiscaviarum]MCP9621825.1 hypothetical protein [Nocardia otitidiscaviarum]SUA75012.1 Uncharacterised protein [Nocardia otitidiscaviarum]